MVREVKDLVSTYLVGQRLDFTALISVMIAIITLGLGMLETHPCFCPGAFFSFFFFFTALELL